MNLEDKTPWEAWILLSGNALTNGPLDKIAELAVSSYNLKTKDRFEECMDRKHCFIMWWDKNRSRFIKYSTVTSLAKLLDMNHSTIIHHMRKRKKSFRFNDNVKCLVDFLTS
jgi:hypothetical protein